MFRTSGARLVLSNFGKNKLLQIRPINKLQYSTTGYGDMEGDPYEAQGVNRRTRELEHPGPSQQHNADLESSNGSNTLLKHPSHIQSQLNRQEASEAAKEWPNRPNAQGKQGMDKWVHVWRFALVIWSGGLKIFNLLPCDDCSPCSFWAAVHRWENVECRVRSMASSDSLGCKNVASSSLSCRCWIETGFG